jgi:FMN-dependent NADH-azoreductase
VFAGDRANQADFLTPYLSAALGCIGLNTVHLPAFAGHPRHRREVRDRDSHPLIAAIEAAMVSR